MIFYFLFLNNLGEKIEVFKIMGYLVCVTQGKKKNTSRGHGFQEGTWVHILDIVHVGGSTQGVIQL